MACIDPDSPHVHRNERPRARAGSIGWTECWRYRVLALMSVGATECWRCRVLALMSVGANTSVGATECWR